jgi:Cof subfamily protein (haloacid dehalogenase superfamily)
VLPTRLVALDLDGTTVAHDGTVTARTAEAVRAAGSAGLIVVLATGRPPRFTERTARELGLTGEAICANGAAIFHVAEQRLTDVEPIGADLVDLVGRLRAELPGLAFAVEWGLEFALEPGFEAGLPEKPRNPNIVADVVELADQEPYKLLATHPDIAGAELVEQLERIVGDLVEPSHSGLGFLEIAGRGVTKATGLARLCARLGVEAAEVLAIGDNNNDLAMIEWAGWGVAMGNASDEVKAVADEVTASNADDGVALVLERLVAQTSAASG